MSLLHLFSLSAIGTVMGIWKGFFQLKGKEKRLWLFIVAGIMGAFAADLFSRWVVSQASFFYPFYSRCAILVEALFGAWLGVFLLNHCLRER